MTNDIVRHELLSYVNQTVYIRSGYDILVPWTQQQLPQLLCDDADPIVQYSETYSCIYCDISDYRIFDSLNWINVCVPSFQAEIVLKMFLGTIAACSRLASEHGDILIFKQRRFVFLPLSFCVPALSLDTV